MLINSENLMWVPSEESLETVRDEILNALLIAIAIFGIAPLAGSLSRIKDIGWQDIMYIQIIAYLVIFTTTIFRRKLRYYHRALILVSFAFLIGCVGILNMGLLGSGIIFMFLATIFATMFLGVRYGVVIIATCFMILITVALGVNQGWIMIGFDLGAAVSLSSWISKILAFSLFSAMLIMSLGRLINYLVESSSILIERTVELQNINEELLEKIAEKKRAEGALQQSEAKYRLLAENATDVIWTSDLDLNMTYVSPSIERFRGYTPQEIMGQSVEEQLTSESLEVAAQALIEEMELESKEDKDIHRSRTLELESRCKDGSTRWSETNLSFIRDAHGKVIGISGVGRDITERKVAEEALRESEEKLIRLKKMESLGLLAGGVAHDLNNVLSGIVSYPELILMDLPEDSKLRDPIETIKESGHRAAAIVQDLLTVARGVAVTKEPLNLNDVVDSYLQSPEFKKIKQFHPSVTVETDLNADLFNMSGSPVHIRKVLMNLVSNAAEAVESSSGRITISTTNRYLDRSLKGYDDVRIGEYVVLSIADDGSGISSDDLERIFEPFYTKKFMGRSGTGLGLAVVWNIVQDHKGYIDVITDAQGSSFELYLPMTREELSVKDLSIPIENYRGNGEMVLVVDDMDTQRDISCKMLDILGYKTKAVSTGEAAVRYLNNNSVDLILLDMIMDPGMNGRETYEKIIEIHPEQKAIIISGFTETSDVKATQKLGAGKYIKKPFSIEKIGLAVQEELKK